MEPKKSIRDIASSSSKIISDMVSEKPVVKKTKKVSEIIETSQAEEIVHETYSPAPAKKPNKSVFKKIIHTIPHIKSGYLISILLIVVLLVVLFFVPSPAAKDPVEQAKVEAEAVKKQLSKHIVLPENEQIDIRKITSKMEDPFFKDAAIGDYLVIFYKNRIAYIFSIEKDIIVNAGVVFIDPKTATTTKTQ